MAGRWGFMFGIAWCAAAGSGAAAAIEVRVPASTAIAAPGQNASVAVSIAPLTGQDMVVAGALSFTYASALATATDATPVGVLAGCTTTTNLTPGRVTLLFACTTPPFDCVGQPGVAALVDLTSRSGGVDAACLATGVTSACSEGSPRDAFGFGLDASGSPPQCAAAPTTATVICASPPLNGFRLLT